MQVNNIIKTFSFVLLASCAFASIANAGSNIDNGYVETPKSTFTDTKNQEVIFKTPDSLKNDTSKLEYKSTVALPTDASWKLVEQQESNSQFNPKIIKKDDNNFLSVVSTNQFPANTVRVVIDKIDVVDVDSRFYRIPNIKTEATNDYLYIPKSTTILAYKPSADDIKNYNPDNTNNIYLSEVDGKYTNQTPQEKEYAIAMLTEKVGNNDWTYPKQLSVTLTANSPENIAEADRIVKGSTYDNQNYQLTAPAPTVVPGSSSSSTPGSSSSSQPGVSLPSVSTPTIGGFNGDNNIIPWIATILGFGILNLGIRQFFKKN
jgi:hypothetical protein